MDALEDDSLFSSIDENSFTVNDKKKGRTEVNALDSSSASRKLRSPPRKNQFKSPVKSIGTPGQIVKSRGGDVPNQNHEPNPESAVAEVIQEGGNVVLSVGPWMN